MSGDVPYRFDSGRVIGPEKVTAGAGTFDTVRVDLSGRVSNLAMGGSAITRGYGFFKQSVWYSPEVKRIVKLRTHDVQKMAEQLVALCPGCTQLLAHALTKRSNCPMRPKPACKHCPCHCYRPHYRAQIRQVMKFSGRYLLLTGRLDYLLHLLF